MPSGGVGTCQPRAVTVVVELGAELPAHPPLPPALRGLTSPSRWFAPFHEPWGLAQEGSHGELETPTRPPTHTCLQPAHLCPPRLLPTLLSRVLHRMEPMGIVGFKAEKLFLSPSPSVVSFLLVVRSLPLAHRPGCGLNGV